MADNLLKSLETYIIVIVLFLGISVSYSINVWAEQSQFPIWLKDTAKLWGEGKLSDSEFIKVLQWLVDQNFIIIPESKSEENQNVQEGFSNIMCEKEYKYVRMTGKYTNGEMPYSVIFLRMIITDANDTVTTGSGLISDIDAHKTKYFDAITRYSGNFTSCTVQIDGILPKSR